jgi:hypothetical protein
VANLRIFRRRYPRGENYIVTHDAERPLRRRFGDVTVTVVAPNELVVRLSKVA